VEAYRANALLDAHKDDPGFGHRVARRQGPRRWRSVVGSHGVTDRIEQRLVVRVWEETGAAMARSPGSPVHDDLCAVTDKDERNRNHEPMAAAGNNKAMESFFTLLQKNILDHRCWATREQLRIAITTRIKRTYHHQHQQTTLNRLTPIEFKATMNTPTPPAARPQPATYPCSSPLV